MEFSINSNSQNNTKSPLSRYGIGDIATSNKIGQINGMAGTGIGLKSSNNLNFRNPASYSGIDSLNFLFEFGVIGKNSTFKSNSSETNVTITNFNYFAIGFRISKYWASSIGILPYSDVGYNVMIKNEASNSVSLFEGTGGLGQFYIGNSFMINDLSLGFRIEYIFSDILYSQLIRPSDLQNYTIVADKKLNGGDLYMDFGLQYTMALDQRNDITFGIIAAPRTDLKLEEENFVYKTLSSSSLIDTISYVKSNEEKGNLTLPLKLGIGAALSNEKIFLGVDYLYTNWKNASILGEDKNFSNSHRISVGGEFTPNKNAFRKYYKKINFRMGAFYRKGYLKINNNDVNNLGLTWGLGLPASRNNILINISFEIGQQGNYQKNIIQENYFLTTLNLRFKEIWFQKPKYK